MHISRVEISAFKRINKLVLPLKPVNLLVGGNNSGKSSALQAIHFAITCLRSANLHGKGTRMATTLGANQFSYLPTNEIMELRHRTPMTQDAGPHFLFAYERDDKKYKSELQLKRGKNANVALGFSHVSPFVKTASNTKSPFSIYVPGLAGLSLAEERRPNAAISSGLAQGDSNLYLRNVLLRLKANGEKLARFHQLIAGIFPGLKIEVSYDEDVSPLIACSVQYNGATTPLELVGTGALQALQLAAYVALYEPQLLLLDEPDAHLHPGNQKQLVNLVFSIADQTDTQVIMASHSRHVLDAVKRFDPEAVRWMKGGELKDYDPDTDLSLLLDIGALDFFEETKQTKSKKVFFCEDQVVEKTKTILSSNGHDVKEILVIPYNGVDNIASAEVVVNLFREMEENRLSVVYRDGDCLTSAEKTWLTGKLSGKFPKSTVLVADFTDIEHYFCTPAHISEVCEIALPDAQAIVDEVLAENQGSFGSLVGTKRSDQKNKIMRGCDVWTKTEKISDGGIPFEFAVGKVMISKIQKKLTDRGINKNLFVQSKALEFDSFKDCFKNCPK